MNLEMDRRRLTMRGSVGSRTSRDLGGIYTELSPRAYRFAYLLVGDRDLAADLVQDAFVRTMGRLGRLRKPDSFESYLLRTVANLAKSHHRKSYLQRSRRPALADVEIVGDHSPRVDEATYLWGRLLRLNVRQRAALVLRFYEDLSEEATADVLGISRAAVNSLVARGLEGLRSQEANE